MEESGRIRRGYFVAGLGRRPVRPARRGGPAAGEGRQPARRPPGPAVVVLAATDPANAYGLVLPWPVKGPQRVAGAWVVLVDLVASLYVERGGKGLVALREFDGRWEDAAVEALADGVRSGRWSRLVLQRYPEELEAYLRAAAFVRLSPQGASDRGTQRWWASGVAAARSSRSPAGAGRRRRRPVATVDPCPRSRWRWRQR